MGRFIHPWLDTNPNSPYALTADNVFYSLDQTIKQKIDSMHSFAYKSSFVFPVNANTPEGNNRVLPIGEFSDLFLTRNFYMSVSVLEPVNISKIYLVSITNDYTAGQWYKVFPISSTSIYDDDFDIDIKTDSTKCYLRMRRTKCMNSEFCGVNIQITNLLANTDFFTYYIEAPSSLVYPPYVMGNLYSSEAHSIGVSPLNGDTYNNLQEFLQEVKNSMDSPNNIIQQIAIHNGKTTGVHGISDTSKLVTISMLSDAKDELNNKINDITERLAQRVSYLELSLGDHLNHVGFEPNPNDWASSGQGLQGVYYGTDSYFVDDLTHPFPFCPVGEWKYYDQEIRVPVGQLWDVTFYYVIRSTGTKSPGMIKLGVFNGLTFDSYGRTYKHGQDKVSSEYTDNIDFKAMLQVGTYKPAYSKTVESDFTAFYIGHYIVKYRL